MLAINRIYYINANPEPFTDEEWFWKAKQHLGYDHNKLPAFQLSMDGWPNTNHTRMIKDNRMADPDTAISVLASLIGTKTIGLPSGTQVLMSGDRIYRIVSYQDVGLRHYKEYTTRAIRRSIKNIRRYYLNITSQAIQSRLGPAIITAAF